MEEEPTVMYDNFALFKKTRPDLFVICGCSNLNVNDLAIKPPTKFLQYLCDAIDFRKPRAYNSMGDNLYKITKTLPDDSDIIEVQWCLDFLYLYAYESELFSAINKSHIIPGSGYKYIALWSFIYGFLGIGSTYDYILMNYLEHKDYIFHGSGIRCAGLCMPNRKPPSDEFRSLIKRWVDECDRNGRNFNIERPWLLYQIPETINNIDVGEDLKEIITYAFQVFFSHNSSYELPTLNKTKMNDKEAVDIHFLHCENSVHITLNIDYCMVGDEVVQFEGDYSYYNPEDYIKKLS